MCQSTWPSQPGQRYRSPGPSALVDQGGWSNCTWSICQTRRRQNKKASVTFPPTGSSSAGRITGAPGQPQTSPFARPLPAAEPGRREVARLEALVAVDRDPACRMTARAIDMQLEAVARDVADRGDGQRVKHRMTLEQRRRASLE